MCQYCRFSQLIHQGLFSTFLKDTFIHWKIYIDRGYVWWEVNYAFQLLEDEEFLF